MNSKISEWNDLLLLEEEPEELTLFGGNFSPSILCEKDLFADFFETEEQSESNDIKIDEIQEVCNDFFAITPLDEIPSIFSAEEEYSDMANLEPITPKETLTGILFNKDILERLRILYNVFFTNKCIKNNNDVLNRCFVLFPETLTFLCIKVRNNESDEYINCILDKLHQLYKRYMIFYHERGDFAYIKRINFRKEMLSVLQNELPILKNHVVLYEKLSKLEELVFGIKILRKDSTFIIKKKVTDIFNIIFLLENETVTFLIPKVEIIFDNINNIKYNYDFNILASSGINIEEVFNKITIMKEIYDGVLPFITSCICRRKKLDQYFKCEMERIQNKSFNADDIYKIFNGLEIYKGTFKQCACKNSIQSFKLFLLKNAPDILENKASQ